MRGARDVQEAPVWQAPYELGGYLVAQRTIRGYVSLNEQRRRTDVRRGVPRARCAWGSGQILGVRAIDGSPEQAPERGPGRHSVEASEVCLEVV